MDKNEFNQRAINIYQVEIENLLIRDESDSEYEFWKLFAKRNKNLFFCF